MPIKRSDFIKGNFHRKYVVSREDHPITVFLRKNHKYAYKANEIAKAVRMKESTVRSMIRQLKKDGIVSHKAPYFAWKKK